MNGIIIFISFIIAIAFPILFLLLSKRKYKKSTIILYSYLNALLVFSISLIGGVRFYIITSISDIWYNLGIISPSLISWLVGYIIMKPKVIDNKNASNNMSYIDYEIDNTVKNTNGNISKKDSTKNIVKKDKLKISTNKKFPYLYYNVALIITVLVCIITTLIINYNTIFHKKPGNFDYSAYIIGVDVVKVVDKNLDDENRDSVSVAKLDELLEKMSNVQNSTNNTEISWIRSDANNIKTLINRGKDDEVLEARNELADYLNYSKR